MDASTQQTRGIASGTTGARTIGALTIILNAAPAGVVNTAVASFLGGTTIQRGTAQVPTPVLVTHDANLGTTFKIQMRGRWRVRAKVPVATAAQVRASLSVDVAAGSLVAGANPSLSIEQPDVGRWVGGAAADAAMIPLEITVDVTGDMAANPAAAIVRLLLNNGAGGAAPAATLAPLADGFVFFERIGDIDN